VERTEEELASRERDTSWDHLKRATVDSDIAYVLGAGVSYHPDDGLPNWHHLVEQLAKRFGVEDEVKDLKARHITLPGMLSFIEQRAKGEWVESVRRVMYQKFNRALEREETSNPGGGPRVDEWFLAGKEKDFHPNLAAFLKSRFRALAAVVKCTAVPVASCRTDRPYGPAPGVRAVLTYNLDSLVQLYDRALHKRRVLRTVERASKGLPPHKIPLYHLHGYLQPRRMPKKHEASDCLVLTETEYHRRTDERFGVAMTSQLWALRECVCVFVGCSMTDELMRRALYRSKEERCRALMAEEKSKTASSACWNEVSERRLKEKVHPRTIRHFAVMRARNELRRRTISADLEMLGVRPLWVRDDFRDLPCRLREAGRELAHQRSSVPPSNS